MLKIDDKYKGKLNIVIGGDFNLNIKEIMK